MLLGEVAPGGVGAGLYGILVLAVIAVFLAGLMVGRTPEYLGKKLGRTRGDRRGDLDPRDADAGAARRRRWRSRSPPSSTRRWPTPAPHGLSEVLYAYASAAQQQRQRLRRADRDQPRSSRPRSGSACCSAGSCRSSPCSRSPDRWPRRSASSRGAGTLPTDRPAVRRPGRRHGRPGRRPHLLPGPGPRARSRRHCHDARHTSDQSTVDPTRPARDRTGRAVGAGAFCRRQLWRSLPDALRKLDPRTQLRNPVMFVVWVGSVLVTVLGDRRPERLRLADRDLAVVHRAVRQPRRGRRRGPRQGAGRDACAGPRTETVARRLAPGRQPRSRCPAPTLKVGDLVVVEAGRGRSPATATSSRASRPSTSRRSPASRRPVIRESGGDRSSVTGGTTVLSDRIVVQITAAPGRVVRRPDDRAGRGRGAAEDARTRSR